MNKLGKLVKRIGALETELTRHKASNAQTVGVIMEQLARVCQPCECEENADESGDTLELRCANPECDGKKVVVSFVEGMDTYFVECFDCGATGPEADTQSEAVRLWYNLGKWRVENVN